MSSETLNFDDTDQIHYVYGDQTFILDETNISAELGDIICENDDGSRAFLIDGQLFSLADNRAIVLDDSETHFVVKSGEDGTSNVELNQLIDNSQIIQFVTDGEQAGEQPIVFYANNEEIGEYLEEDDVALEAKRPKLQNEEGSEVDVSKITGRNLITGQTVTLDSYLEKLKRKIDTIELETKQLAQNASESSRLDDLIDRKIAIGKTKSGKKLVGKIVHIAKKQEEPQAEAVVSEESESVKVLVRKTQTVNKDSLEEISKTLGGVMEMESVRKKLANKNVVVKLVEKRYSSQSDSFHKSVAYSYGYMERDEGQTFEEKWKFVSDRQDNKTKYAVTTSVTIVVTYMKNNTKSIRVNLSPAPGNLCTVCAQYFKSNVQLRMHMDSVHNAAQMQCVKKEESMDEEDEDDEILNDEDKWFMCGECKKTFSTQNRLVKHLMNGDNEDECLSKFVCWLCEIKFQSVVALKKHLVIHTGVKAYQCNGCGKEFLNRYDLNFHRKQHYTSAKHFVCKFCWRTFSRHSNLLRHAEIHKQGNGAALYKCDICSCSYNYMSSLTRHMVQNHLDHGGRQQQQA